MDTQYVRSFFPALQDDFIFMDNAGGSQILQPVIDKVQEYWIRSNVQHGASYSIAQEAMSRVAAGKETLTALLNAKSPRELVMGGSSTLLIRLLSIAMSHNLSAGDEIIVSSADHEANVSPWTDLAKMGVVIKVWNFNSDSFQLELEDLKPLLSNRTKLVACCHVSNIFGAIHNIRPIADLVHQYNAQLLVDGVAFAPHRLVDVQAMDVDFYVYSFYKTFGPHYAVMYGKDANWLQLPRLNHYFIAEDDLPYKMEPGGENYELVYGLTGLGEYLNAISLAHGGHAEHPIREHFEYCFQLFSEHEELLTARLLAYLNSIENLKIIGPNSAAHSKRVATISFVVKGMDSSDIIKEVDKHHIGIRFGDFYAKKIVEQLGLAGSKGVVRVSLAHYNTLEEVDKLILALKTIIA
jgi:cysteine desulfurase family protein (TIGR01976 family)